MCCSYDVTTDLEAGGAVQQAAYSCYKAPCEEGRQVRKNPINLLRPEQMTNSNILICNNT